MRRKSERVKDKDKPVDKKSDKTTKKSRTRSSRRRKKSSSTSPESSETEDYDTAVRSSHDDTEEEHPTGRSKREKAKVVFADNASAVVEPAGEEKVASGRTRRSSKKQTADDEEQVPAVLEGLKSDEKSADGVDSKGETSDPKHKEKEGKSSMWQVKSAEDSSSGEIKKLKICIVRPPEATELSPRKRKKLSRSSHREVADGETDEGLARDSSGERRKSRRTLRHDDSTSPEKKGKHRSGDSSEDGHRTQDSEETTQSAVPVPAAQEESSQDEVMIITTTSVAKEELQEPVKEIHEVSESLVQSRSPCITVEEKTIDSPPQSPEKSIDSPVPSPEPVVKTPVDPFDALKTSDVKTSNKDSSMTVTVDDEPAVVIESVVPCDSTEELQRSQNIVIETDESPVQTPRETVSPVAKSEVCDSSLELPKSQDSPEDVLITRASSEEREIEETIEQQAREPSMKRPALNSLEKGPDKQVDVEKVKQNIPTEDSAKEQKKVCETVEKENIARETLKESTNARDSSEERLRARRLSGEKGLEKSEERSKDRRHSKPRESPEHKSRSRRLNRSTSDRVSRHKTSPHKTTDSEEPSKKENKDKKVNSEKDSVVSEATSKKDKERIDEVSPKKIREERETRRTKVVWEEKPPVEIKRRIVAVPSTEVVVQKVVSSEPVATETPAKPTEKITLKRSTSNKSKPVVADDSEESKRSSVDGGASEEPTEAVPRKRRWGAGKGSSAPKRPVLSISSDSLKDLIPEAKPLTMSEVQLSPEEAEEGEVGDESDHATSDVEEEKAAVEPAGREDVAKPVPVSPVVGPAMPPRVNIVLTDEHRDKSAAPARKISIVTDSMRGSLQRSPSPARHRPSDVLFVTNLVRPFTLNQLKELLARTGTLVEGGFWIDKIKSKCYVQYSTETEARETRHALHGVRWPVSNPKLLAVDFARREDLDLARDVAEGGQAVSRKTEPLTADGWQAEREKERERLLREKEKLERERLRGKEADRERTLKMSTGVREWDVGKMEMGAMEDGRDSRNKERDRRMRKDRDFRSTSPRDGPARKVKKKEEDAPAKLLDDLFKKTKATPCIYWLPLTAEQIVVKEEMRRKHMAEHERRMTEMRKADRGGGGGGGGRNQGRPPQRRFPDNNRDKRNKRRSLSGSPKK